MQLPSGGPSNFPPSYVTCWAEGSLGACEVHYDGGGGLGGALDVRPGTGSVTAVAGSAARWMSGRGTGYDGGGGSAVRREFGWGTGYDGGGGLSAGGAPSAAAPAAGAEEAAHEFTAEYGCGLHGDVLEHVGRFFFLRCLARLRLPRRTGAASRPPSGLCGLGGAGRRDRGSRLGQRARRGGLRG